MKTQKPEQDNTFIQADRIFGGERRMESYLPLILQQDEDVLRQRGFLPCNFLVTIISFLFLGPHERNCFGSPIEKMMVEAEAIDSH